MIERDLEAMIAQPELRHGVPVSSDVLRRGVAGGEAFSVHWGERAPERMRDETVGNRIGFREVR